MANASVYFIRLGKTNYYKIGFSKNVIKRLEHIDEFMPCPIELLATYECDSASDIENQLHYKYAKNRTYREWFRFSRAEARKIVAGLHTSGMGQCVFTA